MLLASLWLLSMLLSVESALLGPSDFSDASEQFRLHVDEGMRLLLFNASRRVDTFVLDRKAASVKGSFVTADQKRFSVSIDFKGETFDGAQGHTLANLVLTLTFAKESKNFRLTDISVGQMRVDDRPVAKRAARIVSSNGYAVEAPLGAVFACHDAGVFGPAAVKDDEAKDDEELAVGLVFPGLQVQVFQLGPNGRFGPLWECGDLISIGLLVGLIMSFFFALIVFWAVSMLADIKTMDKFDDPNGKPLHVPQGD